jgi:hypothetical protein
MKLDFRYAPARWQACIGLPDDPHKSIVGSDGGMYYDYGGGRFHDFRVRVRGDLESEGQEKPSEQELINPRVPVVSTETQRGGLRLCRRAWAGVPDCRDVDVWSRKRVDYLWLELENCGDAPQSGRIVLEIDSDRQLQVGEDRQQVRYAGQVQPFCRVWPRCAFYLPRPGEGSPAGQILAQPAPSVSLNWGRPDRPCDERFRHVLVGYGRPLEFTFAAESGKEYGVAFGLIESWQCEPLPIV